MTALLGVKPIASGLLEHRLFFFVNPWLSWESYISAGLGEKDTCHTWVSYFSKGTPLPCKRGQVRLKVKESSANCHSHLGAP